MLAWTISIGNSLTFVFVPAFAFYMNHFQIEPEEKALSAVFGTEFAAYKRKVRQWLL